MPADLDSEAWRRLFLSSTSDDRELALQLAHSIAPKIQKDLLFAFAAVQDWKTKSLLYALLDSVNQEVADRMGSGSGLPNIAENGNYRLYLAATTDVERAAILEMESEGKDLRQHKMQFYRTLQAIDKRSIKECRECLIDLLQKSKAQF